MDAKYIGMAKMLDDGTFVLELASYDDRLGSTVHGTLTYPPSHPRYAMIKEHVGTLAPGETTRVRPFPDP